MYFRRYLKLSIITIGIVCCCAASTFADEIYRMKYSIMEAPGTPMGEMAARIVEKVKDQTDGKVILRPFYSGQLGDYIQVYEELQMGSIDFASMSIPSQFDDRLNITCVPYSVTNYNQVEKLWLNNGLGFQKLKEILHDQRIELLSPIPYGFMGIGGANLGDFKTILDPSKKQDSLVRVPVIDTYIAMGQAMGFRTTTLPYGDLYSALQSGVADGWMGGTAYVSWYSFRDVIKQYIDAKYVHEITMSAMSQRALKTIPEKYMEKIRKIFMEEASICGKEINALSATAMKNMEEYGITVLNPTDEELKPMAEHVRQVVWPMYEKLLGKELFNEYQAAVEKVTK